jgi:hypothetical protein
MTRSSFFLWGTSMPDTTVKYFASTMSGAPALSGTAGTLIAVLDACLANGFGSVTLDSLVIADNVATGTISTGHGFAMVGSTGPVIRIEGATPSTLNADWRLASVPSSTQFTFTTTEISNQTATGTISVKRAPVGWEKRYSGTNLAAYARTALAATAMLLRADDTPAQFPTLIMYESMSDVNTGTGASTTGYFGKSSAANSTARAWTLFADDRLFYLFANADGSSWNSALAFGDIIPYRSADAFHCLLLAHATQSNDSNLYLVNGATTGAELARSYSQVGGKVASGRFSHRTCTYIGGGSLSGPPNLADNSLHTWPIDVWEGTTIARGVLPGLTCPIHNTALTTGTVIDGERTLVMQGTRNAGNYYGALDATGPWR